jgi:hypothetical protein
VYSLSFSMNSTDALEFGCVGFLVIVSTETWIFLMIENRRLNGNMCLISISSRFCKRFIIWRGISNLVGLFEVGCSISGIAFKDLCFASKRLILDFPNVLTKVVVNLCLRPMFCNYSASPLFCVLRAKFVHQLFSLTALTIMPFGTTCPLKGSQKPL